MPIFKHSLLGNHKGKTTGRIPRAHAPHFGDVRFWDSPQGPQQTNCFKHSKPWFSMDWFKGKSKPETIDFPMKYGVFRLKFSLKPIH